MANAHLRNFSILYFQNFLNELVLVVGGLVLAEFLAAISRVALIRICHWTRGKEATDEKRRQKSCNGRQIFSMMQILEQRAQILTILEEFSLNLQKYLGTI